MTRRSIRLRYQPRRRANDCELRPWYIDTGALWGVKAWTKPMWVGPFKTAAAAVALQLNEPVGA